MKLIISASILVILCIFFVIIKSQKNKRILTNTKITNVEEKIDGLLIKRKELLKDSENIIKDVINTNKNIYEQLSELDNIKNRIEIDRNIMVYINEFFIISNRYKKLKENTNYQKLYYDILETEDLMNAYKDYYNDTALKYNKIMNTFPFSIIYKISGKKNLLFFDRKKNKDIDV